MISTQHVKHNNCPHHLPTSSFAFTIMFPGGKYLVYHTSSQDILQSHWWEPIVSKQKKQNTALSQILPQSQEAKLTVIYGYNRTYNAFKNHLASLANRMWWKCMILNNFYKLNNFLNVTNGGFVLFHRFILNNFNHSNHNPEIIWRIIMKHKWMHVRSINAARLRLWQP